MMSSSRTRRTVKSARLLVLSTAVLAGCVAPEQPSQELPSGEQVWELQLDGGFPETAPPTLFGASPRFTHHELLLQLEKAAATERVRGLLLHIGEMGSAFARADDIVDAVSAVKKRGKKVHCHLRQADNLGYATAARACEEISVTPGGMVNLVGLASEVVYAKELLSSLGVTAELMQVGRFKGAADNLTRNSMPSEVKQMLDRMLDGLHGQMVGNIAQARGLQPEQVQQTLDRGPFTPHEAKQQGLIDVVGFDDAARERLRNAAGVERVVERKLRRAEQDVGLFALVRALLGDSDETDVSGKRLVLAVVDGTIMRGSEQSIEGAHAEPFVEAMRRFADDDDVAGVVLRIDSPGGSADAADRMWHAVRRVEKRKPVIVSVGDMAASGGYYIAAAGREIFARDSSLVGSIGVVGGKLVVEDLTERIGVNTTLLERGKHAAWMSSTRHFDEGERAAFHDMLRAAYRLFLRRIEQGRGMQPEQLATMAEGRLMTGRIAREGGLVDRAGGLSDAIARARELSELEDDAPVESWPKQQSLIELLTELDEESTAQGRLLGQLLALRGLDDAALPALWLAGERGPAAALPFTLRLR